MSESKRLFGDYHKMAHIWARIQAFYRVSRAGEKISPTISLFFRKVTALVLKVSCAKRFKD